MASRPHEFFEHAKELLKGFIRKVGSSPADTAAFAALAFEVAGMIKKRKVPKEIEADAIVFIKELMAREHVLNLTPEQISDYIDKGIAFAEALHQHQC
jgi:hypothetical protein